MISEFFTFVYAQVLNSASNQFLSGGLVLGAIGAMGMGLRKVPAQVWNSLIKHFTVVIDVQSTAISYVWLLHWLEAQKYSKKSRRLSIKHLRLKDGEYKTVFVPARGNHWFFYKNRLLWLSRNVDKEGSGPPGISTDISALLDPKELLSIRLLGRSRETVTALIKEAQTFYEKTDIDMLHTSRYQWSNWQKRNKLKRPLDSVFFPVSANGLIEDARNFVNSADWYRRMGIPYRRGYLFSGPPGTGKSSAAEAMAGALDLPLYILNLASLSDTSLENAIGDLDHMGTAILLIEDIDTVTVDRDNKDKNQKISLGTLLNVLDGVLAADNLILIMTSNNPNNLDPALIRRGRVDKVVEFGMASEDQINGAVKRFIPQTTLEQCREIATWPRPISMAEVQEHLKTMVMKQLDKLPTE